MCHIVQKNLYITQYMNCIFFTQQITYLTPYQILSVIYSFLTTIFKILLQITFLFVGWKIFSLDCVNEIHRMCGLWG